MTNRLISVGVASYADEQVQPLPPCDKEASEVADTMTSGSGSLFSATESVILRSSDDGGKKATRANILHHLERLRFFSEPDDIALFYFSGHGASQNGEGYLFCQDSYDSNLDETGLAIAKVAKLLSNSRAQHKVAILDCCRPGRLIGKPSVGGMDGQFSATVEKDIAALRDAGLAIITACSADQISHLLPDNTGSVFTRFFLDSLKSFGTGDGEFISLQEAYDYALAKCRDWSLANNKQQAPRLVVDGIGGATAIRLAKRVSHSPVATAPPVKTMVAAKQFMLSASRTMTFPREVIPTPSSGFLVVGPSVQYGNVLQDRASEVRDEVRGHGRAWLERMSASLILFYPPETLVRESSTEVSYPDGSLEVDVNDGASACSVRLQLRLQPVSDAGKILDHLQGTFSWEELHLFLVGNTISLADVVSHARKTGWIVPRFSPERLAECRIKGWGKKSTPAELLFYQDEATHALSRIVFKLNTVSDQNTLSSLVAEVIKVLPEGTG